MKPEWDHLPLLGVGATAQVRRDGARVVKVAHASPEARARLRAEATLHRALSRRGLPVPELFAAHREGRFLIRAFVEGSELGPAPSAKQLHALLALRVQLLEAEEALGTRLDFSPANLRWSRGRVVLIDCGERLAAPRFKATTAREFLAEWKRWHASPPKPGLRPALLPPSGRFHVETPVGRDAKAKLRWVNVPLLRKLAVPWTEDALLELCAWSTTARPESARPATRYTDGVGLDLRTGPRGDGRAVSLGALPTARGPLDLMAKGVGPTPLAWKGRAFHEDGRVSFPRTLWEVTAADELARLGFDSPEYLCVASGSASTVDNTQREWPAAVGVRASPTHWRLGHLRAVAHDRERFRALARQVTGAPRAALDAFCDALGADVGRSDALQVHCFNATPGNVRLDGHFVDYSTVRFMRHHLPRFRFLEGAWTVNRTRAVWSQQALLFAEVLVDGGALPERERAPLRSRALGRFLRAYHRGAFAGFARVYGLDVKQVPPRLARAFVEATLAVRALRGDGEVRFELFQQRCAGPRFDLLGRAPEVVRGVQRGHVAPWRLMCLGEADAEARALAERWTKRLREVLRWQVRPARRWGELIRPWLEPEPLAVLLYGRSRPESFAAWKARIASSDGLPEGHHRYREAAALARTLGHVERVTFAGRSEVIVGLSPRLCSQLERALKRVLGPRLVGVVVHGSRVVERRELRRRAPRAFTHGDLRHKGGDGVREFGPSREASSDLDLKVFVRTLPKDAAALERRVARALAGLDAWFPIGSWPRQRLLFTRHRDVANAFRAWNGAEREAMLGKDPIPEAQAAVLF